MRDAERGECHAVLTVPVPERCAVVFALACTGCYSTLDAGYTNRASFRESGGATAVLRGGLGDLRTEEKLGFDLALRGDATEHGSRLALGGSVVVLPLAGWKHEWTPFARAGAWWAPLRGGQADRDASQAPSIELGALLYGSSQTNNRDLLVAGVRADYWTRPDGAAQSTVLGVYVGYGFSQSLNVPR